MTGDEDNRKAPPDNDLCVSKDIIQEEAMRHPQYTLSPSHVQAHTTYRLQKHLRLKDHGPKCRAGTLWIVLCYAVSRLVSLAAACAALRDTPSDSAANDALLATLPNFAELQRRLNRVLQSDLPHALRRRASRLPSTSSPTTANPAPRQCGYRRLDLGRLSFRKMLVWLQHWAEARFGIHDEIATEHLLYE